MKYVLYSLFTFAILAFGITSCGNKAKSDAAKTEEVDKTGKEYTSAYICPMHCKNSGSDKAGTCPVCGMDYVVNKDHKGHNHDGHNHDHHGHDHGNHDGHNHGDHDGHNH